MDKKIIEVGGISVAVLGGGEVLITGGQSALDLMADIDYHHDCQRVALPKECFLDDFFRLSTGVAGEVLQKFSNYRFKLAVIGDFSGYTSKPLRDFIGECNRGNCVFFVGSEAEAIARLSAAR